MSNHDLCSGQAAPSFPMPFGEWDNLFSIFELFPVPVQVFSPDGLSLFVNKEFLNFFHIHDADKIVGKLNVLNDPYIQGNLEPDYLRRVFAGEMLSFQEIRVPSEEITKRYETGDDNPNDIYQDIFNFPMRSEDGSILCVVAVFVLKRIYQSRADAMKAKAYIDEHWLDDFDQEQIACAAGVSPDHLTRLFKMLIGQTPYSYYGALKLEKIKEALRDTNLSVHEAFSACGADYNGHFAGAFKRKVGMTPTEYRATCPDAQPNNQQAVCTDDTNPYPSIETERKLFQIAELFPIPVQMYRPNGDIVFINEVGLSAWNIRDRSRILGIYNLKNDPVVNDQLGLREYFRRALRGEFVLIADTKIPLESIWERYNTRTSDYDIEAIYTDNLNFTVWVKDVGARYVVSVFLTSRIYRGRSDVTKAKEYLENHWREDFDAQATAQAIRISASHLARLFKKQTGMTLYHYYQEIKVEHLKSALRDQNLSIAEAFVSCGFEYLGNFSRFFKEKVGMSPSQYRKSIRK